jgi:hypothetical protein
MKNNCHRPDLSSILAGLKDFQLDTAEYVFRRMYTDPDFTRRFLIADEVGLGKTIVAKGVIGKTVDYLWESIDRIDVVYICSNSDIARQNINRLKIAKDDHFALATRITLLPIQVADLKNRKLNFVSFTPGTSFEMHSSMGIARERILLYGLIERAWDLQGAPPINILRGNMKKENFEYYLSEKLNIDESLATQFGERLRETKLKEEFEYLCDIFTRYDRIITGETYQRRIKFIAELRNLLARTCLAALEPDLIILDEFQRFKHLLAREDEAGELANDLFDYSDAHCKSRVLLLSATPYKMYTMSHEISAEDHYKDFIDTLEFLYRDKPENLEKLKALLSEYRSELIRIEPRRNDQLSRTAHEIEDLLRQVMVRTERLAASADRNGMLIEVRSPHNRVQANDLKSYVALEKIAEQISLNSPMEFWKSSPYLFNFMEDYEFKRKFESAVNDPDKQAAIRKTLKTADNLLLSWEDIQEYNKIDPQNARLRSLLADTLDLNAWQLLWMPPCLPYYLPEAPFADLKFNNFTKRLVFSSWRVVPKVLALLMSYEAERLMFRLFNEKATNREEDREKRKPLLRFARSGGRLTGMALMSLIYPSITLAQKFDPLKDYLKAGSLTTLRELIGDYTRRIEALIVQLNIEAETEGPEDERWYWAIPVLLDLKFFPRLAREWLARNDLPLIWTGRAEAKEEEIADDSVEEQPAWRRHVRQVQSIIGDPSALRLGRKPEDLAGVISWIAMGGMAVCALRSIWRLTGEDTSSAMRDQAARIAYSFITLFNLPEVTSLIRGLDRTEPYWRRALEYSGKGNLQATLDEYFHTLYELLGLVNDSNEKVAKQIADETIQSLTLRTANMKIDTIIADARSVKLGDDRMRCRFALRYGEQTDDRGDQIARATQVKSAFNSPFWPFILATTSVGQEGLDFHNYCHAVVHWNLPANPVDLEQREGRVHRYKGHALRKNIANEYRKPDSLEHPDIWAGMFAAAKEARPEESNDLVPYWIYPIENGARIERHVPALPLSRDAERMEILRRALVAYRMVFGQSRQEDLLNFLLKHLPPDQVESTAKALRIDLAPKSNRQPGL